MDNEAAARTRSKVLVVFAVASIAAVGLYFALGMPGMDHGGSMSSMQHIKSTALATRVVDSPAKVQLLDPAVFDARTKEEAAVVVNVHVPFEGDIANTDLSIPFDRIAERVSRFPADRDTPVLVYCRSGRMSKIAAEELVRLGYRDVADLDGGMLAWERSGRTLLGTDQAGPVR